MLGGGVVDLSASAHQNQPPFLVQLERILRIVASL